MHRCGVFIILLCTLSLAADCAGEQVAPTDSASILTRSASIVLKVPDYQAARERVLALAGRCGAQLRQARTEVNYLGQKHGQLTLQLDARDLDRLVGQIRNVGKLYSERVLTADQTSLHDKLQDRIGLLKQNEGELLGFLHSPRRMRGSDILFVQYRLYQSRVEASDASQERLELARSAKQSRIEVELFEPEPRRTFDWANWHALAVYRSKAAFLLSLRKIVTGLYYAFWFAPFWMPAALVLFLLYRYVRKRIIEALARLRGHNQANPAQE